MNFQEHMKSLARNPKGAGKKEKFRVFTIALKEKDASIIDDLAIATNQKRIAVIRMFIESNRHRLEKLARELERGNPDPKPLTNSEIKAFVDSKKRKAKK